MIQSLEWPVQRHCGRQMQCIHASEAKSGCGSVQREGEHRRGGVGDTGGCAEMQGHGEEEAS